VLRDVAVSKGKFLPLFGKDDITGKRGTLIERTAGLILFSAASEYTANYSSSNDNKVDHNTH
jgi:hypothetical protein